MAWTAPRTWVTAEVVTASLMNTHVRDNFLETGPAVATTSSELIVSDGSNSLAARRPEYDRVNTGETTASTSYTNLATSGPSVTVTTGTRALISIGAEMSNSGAGARAFVAVDISGATTVSAADLTAFIYESSVADDEIQASMTYVYETLSAGSNVFKAEYRVSGGTGSFANRGLSVVPF